MALLSPTPLLGTLRLHPGCSPSHSSRESSTGATLCSPQHSGVTATLQHLCCSCQAACTGTHPWAWLWLHGKRERTRPTSTSPSTDQLMASPAAHQCCGAAELCFCVCIQRAGLSHLYPLPSGSQTAPRIAALLPEPQPCSQQLQFSSGMGLQRAGRGHLFS